MLKIGVLFVAIVLLPIESTAFEWIAHRANANAEIENSLSATKAAWAIPADIVELDVRVSNDGVVYLYHDSEVNSTNIRALDFSQIRDLANAIHTPTLKSILALGAPRGDYLLDLKETQIDRVLAILDVVIASGIAMEKIIFQSWDPFVLKTLASKHPDGRFFYLTSLNRGKLFGPVPKANQVFAPLSALKLEGVSLKGRQFIDREFVAYFQNHGLKVFIWTVNHFDRVKYYRNLGVDGIITDDVSGLKQRFLLLRKYLSYCFDAESPRV